MTPKEEVDVVGAGDCVGRRKVAFQGRKDGIHSLGV